jgi:hypothetical protein
MKNKIHNLDSLEKEIALLRLESKTIEDKLEKNISHLQQNFPTLLLNSFCQKKNDRESEKEGFLKSLFNNGRVNTIVNKLTDRIANRAADGLDELINKLFQKKNREQGN